MCRCFSIRDNESVDDDDNNNFTLMIIIVKKQLQHIPRPPTLPPAVSLDKLHVPTVTLPGRSCGFDRLRMIMLDYVAYGGRPMLLEPDQLGPFSLLPPLKRGFID